MLSLDVMPTKYNVLTKFSPHGIIPGRHFLAYVEEMYVILRMEINTL